MMKHKHTAESETLLKGELLRRLDWLVMIPTYLMAIVVEQISRLSSKVPEERVIVEQMARLREILQESSEYNHVREFVEVVAKEVMHDDKGRMLSKTQFIQNP
jgi:hypothetical protein